MSLTKKDIAEFNKKYKGNLDQLRIDIETLTKETRGYAKNNSLLLKLITYRLNFCTYGGRAYNSDSSNKVLRKQIK